MKIISILFYLFLLSMGLVGAAEKVQPDKPVKIPSEEELKAHQKVLFAEKDSKNYAVAAPTARTLSKEGVAENPSFDPTKHVPKKWALKKGGATKKGASQ